MLHYSHMGRSTRRSATDRVWEGGVASVGFRTGSCSFCPHSLPGCPRAGRVAALAALLTSKHDVYIFFAGKSTGSSGGGCQQGHSLRSIWSHESAGESALPSPRRSSPRPAPISPVPVAPHAALHRLHLPRETTSRLRSPCCRLWASQRGTFGCCPCSAVGTRGQCSLQSKENAPRSPCEASVACRWPSCIVF